VTVHDDDILDFDFVDDETREIAPPSRTGGRPPGGGPQGGGGGGRGPRGPQIRAPHGITPLLRLAGLVALAILVIVLLAVWVQGCAGTDEQTAYGDYLASAGEVGSDSAKVGADLATLLTTPGLTQTELETKLGGFVQRQQLDVERARDLSPPGPLTPANGHAVEALQLRVSGLQGLLDTFRATKDTDDQAAAGEQLSAWGSRLEASDVIWKDLFQGTAQATMVSVFVENPDLYTARSMSSIWQRVHGASTGGTPSGLHGSALAYTKVLPQGTQLSTTTETKITTSVDTAFEVGVTNSGEFQEVGVQVKLTIPRQPSPIVKTGTVDVIDPGETKTVTFSDFPDFPYQENATVQVTITPVDGETKTDNNTAEYPVIFQIAPS